MTAATAHPALAGAIDTLLPQTQCTKCGYQGCRPYAEAIAAGEADINQCPPGGAAGIAKLAALLGRPVIPLNLANGVEGPLRVAVIDESLCIGCTLCVQACPVDAIVGAAKRMHTVVPLWCTGCDLCVPPCPTDCIAMVAVEPPRAWSQVDADAARARYDGRKARLERERIERDERLAAKALAKIDELDSRGDLSREQIVQKKAIVEAAIARARARRAAAVAEQTATPARIIESEGARAAPAKPGSIDAPNRGREALAPSCSPSRRAEAPADRCAVSILGNEGARLVPRPALQGGPATAAHSDAVLNPASAPSCSPSHQDEEDRAS